MKDGSLSLSEEVFDVSSPNIVHRSIRAGQLIFTKSQMSFKAMAHERWFLVNISRNI